MSLGRRAFLLLLAVVGAAFGIFRSRHSIKVFLAGAERKAEPPGNQDIPGGRGTSLVAAVGGRDVKEMTRQAVAAALTGYATLLRNHIFKEDNILYPMADRAFDDGDQAALTADFERVERDDIGPGVHERYRDLARELAGR